MDIPDDIYGEVEGYSSYRHHGGSCGSFLEQRSIVLVEKSIHFFLYAFVDFFPRRSDIQRCSLLISEKIVLLCLEQRDIRTE